MASDVKLNINSFKKLFHYFHIGSRPLLFMGIDFPLRSVIIVSLELFQFVLDRILIMKYFSFIKTTIRWQVLEIIMIM